MEARRLLEGMTAGNAGGYAVPIGAVQRPAIPTPAAAPDPDAPGEQAREAYLRMYGDTPMGEALRQLTRR